MIDEKTKKAAIEKWRHVNVDSYMWSKDMDEDFKHVMWRMGFCASKLYWDLSYSQGSGASFEGQVHDFPRFLMFMSGSTRTYPMLRKLYARHEDISVRVDIGRGFYSHSGTMHISTDIGYFEGAEDVMTNALHKAWNNALNEEVHEFEEDAIRFLRAWANRHYRDLEKEHEYLTSDEQVWAAIEDHVNDCVATGSLAWI